MADALDQSMEACFQTFTVTEVVSIAGEVVQLPRGAKRNRQLLLDTLSQFSPDVQHRIKVIAMSRVGRKRKAAVTPHTTKKRARTETPEPIDVDVQLMDGPFFQPPSKEVTEGAVISMIDRTSNSAIAKKTCMVCVRKLFLESLEETLVDEIPNARHLVPDQPHRAHKLVGQLLLHEEAMEEAVTYICLKCKNKLIRDERPQFALANRMWVGKVPFELAVLTLPERLLVALYFPAAYIVKLYPKVKGSRTWDPTLINKGLKGNVSTYRLNTAQIAGIMSGNTMPPSPQILAAMIGVTFVGAGNAPLAVLPDFLRVRRQRVFEALLWLKTNNTIYSDIVISQDQLHLLPDNDVPAQIVLNTRYSNDVAGLEREQEGYVPIDVEDEVDQPMGCVTHPAVIPLQAHGVVDVHGDSVPDSELMAHALANVVTVAKQKDFLIRKGSAFVNEYARRDNNKQRFDGGPENPNHMLGVFPVLFPYGQGGFEVDRDDDVAYEQHVRWALEYSDGRYRKDLYFIFQAFGVIQKRAVCRSAALQMKRSAFIANKVSFLKLKPQDFVKASAEENRRVAFSNPVVKALRKQLTSLRARVPGTDESRISIRAQVWGTNLYFNPPTIWATLNLPDTSDPVAQVLAGEDIDLDKFVATAGPDRSARTVNIAGDPFAAAEFFHLTIRAILEEAFGITANRQGKIVRKPGIVGVVNAYIGTVEAQARGSLHLHILFWLEGAPSAEAMRNALQTPEFRKKVTTYLKHTIRADIKGTTGDTVLQMKKQSSLGYSRPVDPREDNYEIRRHEAEAAIARAVQVHTCHVNTCIRTKNGWLVCKRRAPWPIATEEWIHPSGEWGPRRVFGRMNAWNPPLLQITRSNQDMKIVTNGHQTKDITFYITMYIAKKQNQASNASALLAKSLAFQKKMNAMEDGARDINKRMIQQCANTLSRQQELSGSEVVSYLMGWGDRFISHNFVPIYWDEVAGALRRTFPGLEKTNVLRRTAEQLNVPIPEQAREAPYDPPVRLRMDDGVFVLKDQLKEYTDRGTQLNDMNYFDYHVDTYDSKPLRNTGRKRSVDGDSSEDDEEQPEIDAHEGPRKVGRPASKRVPYLPEAKRKGCRIIRGGKIETLPHFIGTWFPRPDNVEYYCASMLALLKPWRALEELRATDGTFKTNFDDFMVTASLKQKRIVDNIKYFHECSDSARKNREAPLEMVTGCVDLHDHIRRDMEMEELNALEVQLSEEDVAVARNERYAAREYTYGEGAMGVAYALGIFEPSEGEPIGGPMCEQATMEEMLVYEKWGEKLRDLTKDEVIVTSNPISLSPDDAAVSVGRPSVYVEGVCEATMPELIVSRTQKQQAAVDILNVEQRRAHDIIEQHLRRTLAGLAQDQLLMIVRGEGGTGKTVLLNAIAHTFDYLQASDWLAKTATTGVAASLVGGMTVHSWASIPVNAADNPRWVDKAGINTVQKRKKRILPAKYVNIDECSMMTKRLLAQLSQIIGQVRATNGEGDHTLPFGGMNMILFGDFHQFPPVGNASGALYCHRHTNTQNEIGAALYSQFTTVVTLTEQKRITDSPWKQLLQRLRTGSCTADDMDTLNSLLVSHPTCELPDTSRSPWDTAVLVTPRHGARARWNTASMMKHCQRTGNRMYICQAEDTVGQDERPLDLVQRVTVAGMPIKKTAKLAERVELAVGMRAMVLMNIATEADLANGTRGEVVDIKLDPREPGNMEIDPETGATILQYPPVLILFKPDDSSYPAFEGLPEGILPIVPSKLTFTISVGTKKFSIHRRQLAMTPGYAFTDYKSQGQTIQHVYIDLEKPPTGKLTPFSAYVALSRSKGRDRIRLLRGYEPDLFTTHPSLDLEAEDARLDALTQQTKTMYP